MEKPKNEIKNAFNKMSGEIKKSYLPTAIEYANRIDAAKNGTPIKNDDIKKIKFLEKEVVAFTTASGNDLEKMIENSKQYQLPDFEKLVSKKNNKLSFTLEEINAYKAALAFIKLENIRDLREDDFLNLKISNSGRLSINDDQNLKYNPEKLMFSMLAESRDGDHKFTIQPYAHTTPDNHVDSKTLFVLTDKQRTEFRKFLIEHFENNLKNE